jgi:16S rRNA (cytosine1402-N4)-methyltransferase
MYKHTTVLKKELIDNLNIQNGQVIVDCTFGGGGHTKEIINKIESGVIYTFDLDKEALENMNKDEFKKEGIKVIPIKDNFRNIANHVQEADVIYADLGFSTNQLDKEISFKSNGELDLRIDKSLNIKAKDLVNALYEKELVNIFINNADEKLARPIAKEITRYRKNKLIENKEELRGIIREVVEREKINKNDRLFNPEARIFQALRIAVNDEYNALGDLLKESFNILKVNGRLGIISFHSGEDRIVKKYMKTQIANAQAKWVVEKLRPNEQELRNNSKSHSAILRIIEKI